MLKTLQWTAVLAAVTFFLSLAGIAYYSSPPSGHPRDNQPSAEQEDKYQTEEQHTSWGLIQFMFPDSISIFTFWLVLATFGLAIVAVIQIGFLNRTERISTISAQAAKTAAEAAKQSADATIAIERPYLFVSVAAFIQTNGPTDPSPHFTYSVRYQALSK
jgi:hypothetical protein